MYVIIIGCGRVGSDLAKILVNENHDVVIIDIDPKSFERLGRTFNGITLVGNGFDWELLKSAGIEKTDAFCAVTNSDNTNLVAAQVAKKIFKVPKVIARVYNPNRANIYRALGLDIISGTILVASMIRDKIVESRLSSFLIESGDVGVLEIFVDENIRGKTVSQINISGELIVATIRRNKEIIIPQPETKVQDADILIAIVKTTSLDKIKKLFKLY
ncbi:MAG: TrkA family potassium uptake protein [Candidatus Omnitrophica bacterium]|nr:TrkA family potassium uptake protein [Candidatus Omnitrophota bacterium]